MPRAIDQAKPAILEAARRLMAEHGYARLAMRQIASRCGIATGTLYNYYPAKDAIVYALMLEDWATLLADLDARLAKARGGDPHVFLRSAFEALRRYFATYRDVWTQMAATPPAEKSDAVRAYDSGVFVRDLASRIDAALPPPGPGALDRAALLDLVVHLFSTYASLPGYGYDFLEPAIRRLADA
jgi:AcrR family transcriptional regulator